MANSNYWSTNIYVLKELEPDPREVLFVSRKNKRSNICRFSFRILDSARIIGCRRDEVRLS